MNKRPDCCRFVVRRLAVLSFIIPLWLEPIGAARTQEPLWTIRREPPWWGFNTHRRRRRRSYLSTLVFPTVARRFRLRRLGPMMRKAPASAPQQSPLPRVGEGKVKAHRLGAGPAVQAQILV